jgi:hypothetical protein
MTLTRHSTTGTIGMYSGTTDGQDPYIDFTNDTSNLKPVENVPITVEDMRYMDPKPTFASHGYEYRSHVTNVTPDELALGKDTPESKKYIEDNYMSEVVDIIKEVTGGAEVVANGFRLRHQVKDGMNVVKSKVAFGTVNAIHVDRDPTNAHFRLKTSVGEEKAEELMKKWKGKKWASVNVWRTIGDTVEKWPLMFVNRHGISDWTYDTHMIHVNTIGDPAELDRGAKGHETVLLNDPRYQYHYASKLTKDEVLVFASFHSDPKQVVPHGAFWDDNSPEIAPSRRSIEARCWVFWDEDE